MSSEHDEQQHEENKVIHTYDGIEEYDNKLPLWWQYTLYGAIVFAIIYWFDFQVLKIHPGPKGELDEELAVVAAANAERARASGPVTGEMLVTLSKDPKTLLDGKTTFSTVCAACHRADGGGNIGPNLTDAFWLHGGTPEDIYKCAHDGVTAKGMPAWGAQLGDDKVSNVVAYVLTIQNTNVPGGKPPQGEKM
jgi:cytochrome c oxidase cbb3-type subunit 3